MLSGDLGRVFEEFLKGYVRAVYGHEQGLVHLRVYLSVQAMYCTANALYWKSFESQNSTHLTLLKHQNTKTAL